MLCQPPEATLVETSQVLIISYAWVHPGSQGSMASGVQWRKPPTYLEVLTL